ncbi:MAG: hypothetical protein ACM3Q4_11145 [Acidobacteriota bacterium]
MTRFTSRMIGIAIAALVVSFIAAAQPQRITPQERTDRLAKELSLTKEQKEKVLEIFTKQQESMRKVFEENQGDRESMRPAMQKVRQESDDQMKKVLTKEQYEKWIAQRAEFQGGRRGGQRPPKD